MLLSDISIKNLIEEGKLIINPTPQLKSASIRLHLSNEFAVPGEKVEVNDEFVLGPKKFILGATIEKITLPDDHAGLYDGSTTLARTGITSHMGSMLVSPGSNGNLTLELFNASDKPFILKKGMRIGQLLIIKMDTASENPQSKRSKYTGDSHQGLVMPNQDIIYETK